MSLAAQKILIFCLIMLPITFEQARRFWYLVLVWIGLLIAANYFFFSKLKDLLETQLTLS